MLVSYGHSNIIVEFISLLLHGGIYDEMEGDKHDTIKFYKRHVFKAWSLCHNIINEVESLY